MDRPVVMSDEDLKQIKSSLEEIKMEIKKMREPIPLSDKWIEHHKALQIFQSTSRTISIALNV